MNPTVLDTQPKEKKAVKNILAGLACFAVTTSLLFSVFAVRYHYFLKNLDDYYSWAKNPAIPDSEFPKLTGREMANLGYAQTPAEHPPSSYINFPEEKKPGVIRIGTFGDSYTQGIEAAEGHDYPSFLQKHFKDAGFENVEVINFGVKGYGMYQSILMHEYLGKKYDLDYAVFMLLGIHTRRDYSFIKDREGCVGVHARYIFKDDKLEFVPTVGENRKEASLNYFRMFPPLRYIRYDKKPPSFMRALLPPGRDWKFNPFYYNPPELANHELILNSYALLFQKAARETGQVVVIANDDFMSRLAKIVKSPNVYVLKSRMVPYLNRGFYLAPRSHRSAMGNDLQARELFTLLTGGKKPELPVLQIRETEPGGADPGLAVEPIGHYENLSVYLGGNPAAALTKMMNTSVRITKEIDLSEEKVTGLLFLSHAQMSFLPLDFRVKQGEPVYLLFRKGRDFVRRAIGKIDTRSGVVSRIIWSGYHTDNEIVFQMKEGLVNFDREMSGVSIKTPEKVKDVQILIGNKKVLDGKRQESKKGKEDKQGDDFEWDTKKKLYYLRASSGQYLQIESMVPEKGSVELVLSRGNGDETHLLTFLEYEVAKPAFRPFYPAYSNSIRQVKAS